MEHVRLLSIECADAPSIKHSYSPWALVSTHLLSPSLGRVEAEERGFGEGLLAARVDANCQWTPPRKLASSFPTLPKEGEMCYC